MNRVLLALILIGLNAVLARTACAAQVTYWFSGYVERIDNPSNALPFSVTVGAPFAGRVSYDTSQVSLTTVNHYPEGDVGSYYFKELKGLSATFQIAGHTVTNATDPSGFSGAVGLYDEYNDGDSYWMDAGKRLSVDGTPFLSPPYFSSMSLYLDDDTKTAFSSAALPTNAPVLASFANNREFRWGAYRDDGGPTRLFSVSGVITTITSSEQIFLNCRPAPQNLVTLGWPASYADFILESTTDLASGNWQSVTNPIVDLNGEHTVTVEPAGVPRFFRLAKQ